MHDYPESIQASSGGSALKCRCNPSSLRKKQKNRRAPDDVDLDDAADFAGEKRRFGARRDPLYVLGSLAFGHVPGRDAAEELVPVVDIEDGYADAAVFGIVAGSGVGDIKQMLIRRRQRQGQGCKKKKFHRGHDTPVSFWGPG